MTIWTMDSRHPNSDMLSLLYLIYLGLSLHMREGEQLTKTYLVHASSQVPFYLCTEHVYLILQEL